MGRKIGCTGLLILLWTVESPSPLAVPVQGEKPAPEVYELWHIVHDLGLVALRNGQYADAEKMFSSALVEAEKFGEQDRRFTMTLNNLASTFVALGKLAEAEPLYERALSLDEKARGREHPDVATDLNNLAELYRIQGRYARAEQLYRQALAIDEKALGAEHPSVATDLNNLALVFRAQRRYGEAEQLYRRALAIKEKAMGRAHPSVAATLHNLAALYGMQGRHAEAEELYGRALTIYEQTVGADHPDLAICLEQYSASLREHASLLRRKGQPEEAHRLEAQAIEVQTRFAKQDRR